MIKDNIVFCICDFETTGLDPVKDFPIEIGCIFTDNKFNELGRYESLISWPSAWLTEGPPKDGVIKPEHLPAYQVHGIPIQEVLNAPGSHEVTQKIAELVAQYKPKQYGKAILLSDNIRFEWQFMQELFGENLKVEQLFHYAGWDVNLALELAGVDRPKVNKAHRALADCEGLLAALQEYRDTRVITKKGSV